MNEVLPEALSRERVTWSPTIAIWSGAQLDSKTSVKLTPTPVFSSIDRIKTTITKDDIAVWNLKMINFRVQKKKVQVYRSVRKSANQELGATLVLFI